MGLDVAGVIQEYRSTCAAQGAKVNPLVVNSLEKSGNGQHVAANRFFIDAPGNKPSVFGSRIDLTQLTIFNSVFSPLSQSLQRLDLSYNFITDEGVAKLKELLVASSALRHLVLTGNEIGPDGCKVLLDGLRANAAGELRTLDLSRNPLKNHGGLAVAEFLQKNELLQELNLEETQIEIDALIALAAVLHVSNTTLRSLNVSGPSLFTLQEEHTTHFGLMLRMNTGLKRIHLGRHQMYDSGVGVMVHYLVQNRTLRALDLRSNQIGWRGAHSLATLLKEDCLLEDLNLSHNRIGEKDEISGAEALGEALQQNRSLLRLSLGHNQLCGEALLHISNGVAASQNIQQVVLFQNNWNQAAAKRFDRIFKDTARITPLEADFSTYVVDGKHLIAEVAA
jgi:Ran GTPase-activating protein (RanGAP) involved in mRNA processing and transport